MKNLKKKIKQCFCKHNTSTWYKKKTSCNEFYGEWHFGFCDNCGKNLGMKYTYHDSTTFK